MNTVADALAGILLRPVVDKTDISGTFNLQMKFADAQVQVALDPPTGETGDATAAPTIFTAITEQLGLKLEPGRAPSPVFVVERVHRPSAN